MIRSLKYVNSRGDSITFGADPERNAQIEWRYGVTDVFNMELDYIETAGVITSFDSGIQVKQFEAILLTGSTEERNRFTDVMSYDTQVCTPLNNSHGCLYAGNSYLECYVRSFSIDHYQTDDTLAVYTVEVVTDKPRWVQMERITLMAQDDETYGGLNYPHDYPHNYLYSSGSSIKLNNPFSLPCACDIAFPGPCTDPYLIIGDNRYQVKTSADAGHLMMVRGYGAKDIVVRDNNGFERSVFSKGVRSKGAQIFEKVPPGESIAAWSGAFNIELTLYNEGLVPAW